MFGLRDLVKAKFIFCTFIGIFVIHSSHLLITCAGESVNFTPCGGCNTGNDSCWVSNVAIEPCPEALENETCNMIRGTNSTISFEFIPPFSANQFETQIYSTVLLMDIPDIDHERPGCKYTKCPITAGQKHSFRSTRFVKEIYPAGTYHVKYRLWHESSKHECCFIVGVSIV